MRLLNPNVSRAVPVGASEGKKVYQEWNPIALKSKIHVSRRIDLSIIRH